MKVTVKYFASIREAIGTASELRNTTATTLQVFRDELIALGGSYAECLARDKTVRLALNQIMVDEATDLTEGAEVAFFPPVTGG